MLRRRRSIEPPSWSGGGAGPRILFEHPDAWAYARVLHERGFTVAACRGPEPHGPCPLVAGGACAVVEEADLIVSGLPEPQGSDVLRAVRRRRPDVTVVLEGTGALRPLPTPEELASAVEGSLAAGVEA